MIRDLHKDDLKYIVYGSSFYGGGGGGSMEEGEALLAAMLAEDPDLTIKMYDVEDMEDDPAVVSTMVARSRIACSDKGKNLPGRVGQCCQGYGGRSQLHRQNAEIRLLWRAGRWKHAAATVRGMEERTADPQYRRQRQSGS